MSKLVHAEKLMSALKLWFQAGDVFEIRILDAVTRAYQRPHIESGYFEYDAIDMIPNAISHINAFKGIYVTINPLNPDLLCRAVNRVRAAGREPTASDADVIRRRWLLVDCDPKRTSGIPSNDAEHELARQKAIEIRDGFQSMGWPDPIMTDSGNGAQLMYRIDLPTDDNNLVHNVLKRIAAVSSDAVDVDVTVHNPARIWRCPGTMNAKGDSTIKRPHRMAEIISVPKEIQIVSEQQLIDAAGDLQQPKQSSVYTDNSSSDFSLDQWIADHCTDISGPQPWKDGRKWVFDVCPFNSDHTNRSAVITEQANGAIGFTCHHNGCKDHDWDDLRDLLEPERIRPIIEPCNDVDLSLFFERILEKRIKKENPFDDPGAIPEDLLAIPGLVNQIIKADLESAPYPNRTLAFAGALSMVAHLAGRKFRDCRNNLTNLYLIALANSGTGKDHPRKVNLDIATVSGIQPTIADSFASGAGLEDAMYACPAQLFQMDEVDWVFNTLKGAKDAAMSESINEKLLKFYSSSNSIYSMRKKAFGMNNPRDNMIGSCIYNPCLNLFGTAVPDYFYESLSRRVLENGLVARCIIIEADKRGKHGTPGIIRKHFSPDFYESVQKIVAGTIPDSMLGEPNLREIPETGEASALLEQYRTMCDDRYDGFENIKDRAAMALWARAMEKVYKLAMVYAVSVNPESPRIDATAVRWSFRFVDYVTRKMLFRAGQYCYESEDDKVQKRFLKVLHDAAEPVKHSTIMRKLHLSKRDMKEIVESLVDAERIKVITGDNGRRFYIEL